MACYASLSSLKHTIHHLLNSSHISIVSSSREILNFVCMEAESLQEALKKFDDSSSSCWSNDRVNALDGEIREAVCELEDAIESTVSDQLESLEGQSYPFFVSLDQLHENVDSFTQMVKKMKEEYMEELSKPLPEEDYDYDYDHGASSIIDFDGNKWNMVGLYEYLDDIIDRLTDDNGIDLESVPLVGMAGIGKTILARNIFEDSSISHHFPCRAWVTVGTRYQLTKIMQSILVQVNPENSELLLMEGDKELSENLYDSLSGRRYLIVLDDVWDTQLYNSLKKCFPKNGGGNRVLLTTRLQEVVRYIDWIRIYNMRFLDNEESWYLLRQKVFPDGSCPPKLVEAGKKIAEKCDGLPLTIVTIAGILSIVEKTPEYWNEIATTEKQHPIFKDAYDQMSEVLLPSYNFLPQYLKACFLYLGVFPKKYVIPSSMLIKLWSAEGFLGPNLPITIAEFALECLEELVNNNIVINCQASSTHTIKTCSLHSVFWHLCNKVAVKNKVFHVWDSYSHDLEERIKSVRRLSVQNGVLFSIKDVYDSMTSSSSTMRSLLCTGPHHQYPVPICFALRLLKVIDALAIRFYQFPNEVLKLLHLRYLAITYNGKLPATISKLWNLQYLIVRRNLSIKSSDDSSYLPSEIWKMQELKHLEITGSILPDPCGANLPNLGTLLEVSAHSCTRKVVESIPNLKKLGIRIELAPDTTAIPLCCFDHISHFQKLESLKCVIENPELKFEVVVPPVSLPVFPLSLKKLSLSGFGFPWEYMKMIASLPDLEVLKLRSYAFHGPEWEIFPGQFESLQFLRIEDSDLMYLRVPKKVHLHELIIRHCYKLQDICLANRYVIRLELIDCNPSVQINYGFRTDNCVLHFSWEERKFQT